MNLSQNADTKSNSKNALLRIPTPLVVGFFILMGSLAQAEIGDAFILCKHNKVVRTLRVDAVSDSQCKAVYTKEGVDKVIGASQNKEVCGDVLNKVRKNLEEGSWACREVKESRLSNLGPDESR